MRIGIAAALAATLHIAHAAPPPALAPALIQGRTPADSQVLHNVQLQRCPLACEYAGPNTVSWTTYHSYEELALCDETVLFSLNIRTTASDPRIKACSTAVGGPRMQAGAFYGLRNNNVTKSPSPEIMNKVLVPAERKIISGDGSCGATLRKATLDIETKWSSQQGTSSKDELSATLSQLEKYFRNTAGCGSALMFARSNNSVVGAFAGGDLAKSAVADLIKGSHDSTEATVPSQYAVQACGTGGDEPAFDTRFGLFADLNGDATSVQAFLKDYSTAVGKCVDLNDLKNRDSPTSKPVTTLGSSITVDGAVSKNTTSKITTSKHSRTVKGGAFCRDLMVIQGDSCGSLAQKCGISGNDFTTYNSKANLCSTLVPNQYVCCSAGDLQDHTPQLKSRAFCRDLMVIQGDSCGSLATRCGISGNDFMTYNSKKANLCSTLMPKQYVCCTTGDLQDHTPQPLPDGNCFPHEVQKDDGCWDIADAFGIDVASIETYNKKTFGFAGCNNTLKEHQVLCLSSGNPPMPIQDPTTVCGPWVVGTTRPANYDDVAKLNPCPLNACCDIWGQCGTTTEFCTASEIDGHPGTAKPFTNGCISNCGTDIVNNSEKVTRGSRVGYFESFNKQRPCLHMDVTQFNWVAFTHLHFAFATISNDFKVTLAAEVKGQFDKMVAMDSNGGRKVLSFGGWSFSTDYDTAPIFSQSVSPANRETFATNVVQFLKDNSLDGLDFDWEYPGATDIPNSVPGSPDDGANYLAFLQSVRSKLPEGKTLSIALPASYWYLRGFPVEKMAKVVDYFVFMTYDLHGQWDYGSKWSNPGCPSGNCLRSHVNLTETTSALSMVTKAGAMGKQIMLGVTSYGRSFKMKDPLCTGVNCQFTGSPTVSDATPGDCTGEPGYIANAELQLILKNTEYYGDGARSWFDEDSSSDIMVYDGNWVSYMENITKARRILLALELNLGGTSDWAVDLAAFLDPVEGDDSGGELIPYDTPTCTQTFDDMRGLAVLSLTGRVPDVCRPVYALGAMATMLDGIIANYSEVRNNYDGKFGYYEQYIKDLVAPQLYNYMDYSGTNQETKQGLGNRFFNCKYVPGDRQETPVTYNGPCPVPLDIMDTPKHFTTTYTLLNKTAFEEGLMADLGIMPDWVVYGEANIADECHFDENTWCYDDQKWVKGQFPLKSDNITVQDPKEIWDQALPKIEMLKNNLTATTMSIGLGLYDPDYNPEDAAIALFVPVQMLAQAVDNMAQVKEIGEEIEAAKKKELILLIIGVIFAVVPFLAELTFSLAGLAALARFAFVSGEIANGALTISDIIQEPGSAPVAIMGMLFGFGAGAGLKSEEAFSQAGQMRKLMTDVHVSGIGKVYKRMDGDVQTSIKACYKKGI
ncbi:hypothetical protein V492_00913 [Pseudogymnoascus sp. VKM F-4246]|nr:hypothetical protein V492_00913 [Pseudogymnoascus sp. VKM F-4246]